MTEGEYRHAKNVAGGLRRNLYSKKSDITRERGLKKIIGVK